MSNDITVALIALGGTVIGGIISSVTTYLMQKRQMKSESQGRLRQWKSSEFAGRTADLKATIGFVEILYRDQQSPISNGSLEEDKRRLLDSLQKSDFWFIQDSVASLKKPCEDLVEHIYRVATIDDFKADQASQVLEEAHDLALSILKRMDEFKQGVAE